MSKPLHVYTDGAFSDPYGGIAFYCLEDDRICAMASDDMSTNNRAELLAIIEALKFYKDKDLTIFSDSIYSINGITKWINTWKTNGWKTSNKKDVLNKDLWKQLDALVGNSKAKIKFQHVKGHSTDSFNQIVDKYAVKARLQLKTIRELNFEHDYYLNSVLKTKEN